MTSESEEIEKVEKLTRDEMCRRGYHSWSKKQYRERRECGHEYCTGHVDAYKVCEHCGKREKIFRH